MTTLTNRIDFMAVIIVDGCNPNGDPVSGNSPRIDIEGFGEISDVCIKRKIRNRMEDLGNKIFVVSTDRVKDGIFSSSERFKESKITDDYKGIKDNDKILKKACKKWLDVRTFGQVIGVKGSSISIPVRGPMSVGLALSIKPIFPEEIRFSKSTNFGESEKKDSTTFGNVKHVVSKSVYVAKGSFSPQLAEITGFSNDDAQIVKECIKTMFVNDESSSRPAGTMEIAELFWWTHESRNGNYSPAKVFRSVKILPKEEFPYYETKKEYKLENVTLEIINNI